MIPVNPFWKYMAFALLVGAGTSCVLLSAAGDTIQCEADADCTALDAAATCSDGVCVVANDTGTTTSTGDTSTSTSTGGSGCVSNAQCVADNQQLPFICRAPGEACVPLLTPECSSIIGDVESVANDAVIILGHLMDYSGNLAEEERQRTVNGLTLGVEEVAESAVGLPGGSQGARRPMVFLSCDIAGNADAAVDHLLDDVGVPSVIMSYPSDEGLEFELALQKFIPKGTMVLATHATSPQWESIQDDGLVWHVNSPSTDTAAPIAHFPEFFRNLLVERGDRTEDDPIKISMIVRSDVVNTVIGELVYEELNWNGLDVAGNEANGDFTRRDYNPENADLPALVQGILEDAPDIVLYLGEEDEFINGLLRPVEQGWDDLLPRPYYLYNEDARGQEMKTYIIEQGASSTIGFRNFSVSPSLPASTQNYSKFSIRYTSRFESVVGQEGVYNAPASYDAAYLMANAIVGAGSVPSLRGADIAQGMRRLIKPGAAIDIGPTDINTGFSSLVAGTNIDFYGTLSEYEYDTLSGFAPRRQVVQCAQLPGVFLTSLYGYDTETSTFEGSWASCDPWLAQ